MKYNKEWLEALSKEDKDEVKETIYKDSIFNFTVKYLNFTEKEDKKMMVE
mgnify:CR=1 FL=1